MTLTYLPLEQLTLSPLNVRAKGGKEVADLVASIRSLGIIQPLLVRAGGDGFEIVAGQRRYHALMQLAEEGCRIRALLGIAEEGDEPVVRHGHAFHEGRVLADVFGSLMHLEDGTVLRNLAYLMAETLEAHTGVVDGLGTLLGTDMRRWWRPDESFLDLLRDKPALNAMVREVAGDAAADANLTATAKVQRKIVADCLNGTRTAQVKDWLPRYMAFPPQGYTERFQPPRPEASEETDAEEEADTEPQGEAEDDDADGVLAA